MKLTNSSVCTLAAIVCVVGPTTTMTVNASEWTVSSGSTCWVPGEFYPERTCIPLKSNVCSMQPVSVPKFTSEDDCCDSTHVEGCSEWWQESALATEADSTPAVSPNANAKTTTTTSSTHVSRPASNSNAVSNTNSNANSNTYEIDSKEQSLLLDQQDVEQVIKQEEQLETEVQAIEQVQLEEEAEILEKELQLKKIKTLEEQQAKELMEKEAKLEKMKILEQKMQEDQRKIDQLKIDINTGTDTNVNAMVKGINDGEFSLDDNGNNKSDGFLAKMKRMNFGKKKSGGANMDVDLALVNTIDIDDKKFGGDGAAIDEEGAEAGETSVRELAAKYPTVSLYGPCGAPSQSFWMFKANIFVAAGVGITPFISILEHLHHNMNTSFDPNYGQNNVVSFDVDHADITDGHGDDDGDIGFTNSDGNGNSNGNSNRNGNAIASSSRSATNTVSDPHQPGVGDLSNLRTTVTGSSNSALDNSDGLDAANNGITGGNHSKQSTLPEYVSYRKYKPGELDKNAKGYDKSIEKKLKVLRGQNLIWSSRSLEEFSICKELLVKLASDDRFNIQLYLTKSDDKLKESLKDGTNTILPRELHHCVNFGRPKYAQILSLVKHTLIESESGIKKVGVFCTAPKVIEQQLHEAIDEENMEKDCNFKFAFLPESF